jgi:hypothetical protein
VNVEFDLPPKKRLPAGGWTLRLSNPGANPVPFDCWIERPDDYTQPFLTFTSHATDRKTVTIPGTAAGAITVGAYAQEPHQGKIPELFGRHTSPCLDAVSYACRIARLLH